MDKNPFPFFMTFRKDTAYLAMTKIRISSQFVPAMGYLLE